MQAEAENMKIVATTAHKPTDTDFTAAVAKLREAKCDLLELGTIVRDTMIIISTVKKAGWDVDLLGQAASYDTAVATAPGGTGEGFYSMTPTLYVYPDDPRPEIRDLMARYRARYGIDICCGTPPASPTEPGSQPLSRQCGTQESAFNLGATRSRYQRG